MSKDILSHEGQKYLRTIHDAIDRTKTVKVDVYEVLKAFNVTCPARQHCIKKLLCAGIRGKGSQLEDLNGAEAALCRAIDFQAYEERKTAEEALVEIKEQHNKAEKRTGRGERELGCYDG